MKKIIALVAFFCVCVPAAFAAEILKYEVAETPWAETLGSQRAVIKIEKPELAHILNLKWRRHDRGVEDRQFIIINAETGERVENIHRISVDNETCIISFGPTQKAGKYYFYYLPYEPQKSHGWYQKNYLKKEAPEDPKWWQISHIADKGLPVAEVLRIEARTPHDSFFPMEVAATKREVADFKKASPQDFYVFLEDRKNPIKMREHVPAKWLRGETAAGTTFEVCKNEYFTFQMGAWAATEKLDDVKIEWTDFSCGDEKSSKILAKKITCFNTEGINPRGKYFTKTVNVPAGHVQAFWLGVDVAPDQASGEYAGTISITPKGKPSARVPVKFRVTDEFVADRGDSVPANMTRLRWLNSTLGIDDTPIPPYSAIKKEFISYKKFHNIPEEKNVGFGIGVGTGKSPSLGYEKYTVLGREILFMKNEPFPQQITANGETLFADSNSGFDVKIIMGGVCINSGLAFRETSQTLSAGVLKKTFVGKFIADDSIKVNATLTLEFDGWMKYSYTIIPQKDVKARAELEMKFNPATEKLIEGIGLPGQKLPTHYCTNWKGETAPANNPPQTKKMLPFDSFWVGDANVGAHVEFLGANYHGPLLNLYRPAPPATWNSGGKGWFEVSSARAAAFSGEIQLKKGVPVTFEFAILPTPVKPLDTRAQFTNRYYHSGGRPVPSEQDFKDGVRVINVHHANRLNPIINYPFITVPAFKKFAAECHAKNAKVKIYYTVRELTTALPELWALRSLGHEIFAAGKGGNGFPWLREHLVDDYYTQWYAPLNGEFDQFVVADAALLTATGESRWLNYYIEGLRWLCKNADIDGIYMDDVAFDRHMLKRMRRAMAAGGKPDGLIDLHSNTAFSIGPANQYADFFPYVDKIWFGESFRYNEMSPENWLVECSGIPFGLMGDTLQAGGNPWLSMQYGMSARHPWSGAKSEKDPRKLWKLWDAFGIADAKMLGWWDKNCPVIIFGDGEKLRENVKATVYLKDKSALISVGNYSTETERFSLDFDWEKLGISWERARLRAVEIPDMQKAETFPLNQQFFVPAKRGLLLILEEANKLDEIVGMLY